MKLRIVVLFFLLLGMSYAYSQYRQPSSSGIRDKIYFGGGGGLSGGTEYLNISLSPLVGYKLTDRLSAGVQVTYQYIKWYDNKISNYGGGPFARFNLSQKLFTYTQYEHLNFGYVMSGSSEIFRANFDSWFVGLGYSEPIGDRVAFNVTALYNLLYKDGVNSPYPSPFQFRIGIVAGLF